MANVKISELSAVSSLSPTDVLPSVAGSTTSKITVQDLANSLTEVSSSISASYATTASYYGGSVVSASYATTASYFGGTVVSSSYAVSASWAPGATQALAVTGSGSSIYSVYPSAGPNFSAIQGIFLGSQAGLGATDAEYSNFIGYQAGSDGYYAYYSNFIGYQAGYSSVNAGLSNFIGVSAGFNADNASYSNFIGQNAGQVATNASYSNFLGWGAGANATSSSYSNFIGYKAGASTSPSSNNIIIGTNITLENSRKDSLNIGGIIFATGSYSSLVGNAFSGSMTEAKVGINKSLPDYTLDVSGSLAASSFVVLTQVSQSLDFVDDAAAQAGGVPLGGLYRSGSLIVIRLV